MLINFQSQSVANVGSSGDNGEDSKEQSDCNDNRPEVSRVTRTAGFVIEIISSIDDSDFVRSDYFQDKCQVLNGQSVKVNDCLANN